MDNQLKGILDILNDLNLRSDIIAKEGIQEQYDNVNDFKELMTELDELLNHFNKVNRDDGDKVEEILFELHRIITTFEWHISEISELNTSILKDIKIKSINESNKNSIFQTNNLINVETSDSQ